MTALPDRITVDELGVDEVFVSACDSIHLERMTNDEFWIGISKGDKRLSVRIHAGSLVKCIAEWD